MTFFSQFPMHKNGILGIRQLIFVRNKNIPGLRNFQGYLWRGFCLLLSWCVCFTYSCFTFSFVLFSISYRITCWEESNNWHVLLHQLFPEFSTFSFTTLSDDPCQLIPPIKSYMRYASCGIVVQFCSADFFLVVHMWYEIVGVSLTQLWVICAHRT